MTPTKPTSSLHTVALAWGPRVEVFADGADHYRVVWPAELGPEGFGLPDALFDGRPWLGATRCEGLSEARELRMEAPRGVGWTSWVEGLTPGQRLWQAPRVAVSVAIFWESWRNRLVQEGYGVPMPILSGESLFVTPGTGAVVVSLAHALPAMSVEGLVRLGGAFSGQVPPEFSTLVSTDPDAAVVYQLGRLVRQQLGLEPPRPSHGSVVHALLEATAPPPALPPHAPLPAALAEVLGRATSPDPGARPSLPDFVASMLQVMGSEQPPSWLSLPLDGIAEHLRDSAFGGDVAEAALLFAVRPDVASAAPLRDYVWGHFGESLMGPLRAGASLPALHAGLLRYMPAAAGPLGELLLEEELAPMTRVEAARILGGLGTPEAHAALARALDVPVAAVAFAARDALAASPKSPPLAWYPKLHTIAPCSVAWDAMEPVAGDERVRTCQRCDQAVVRAADLEALEPLIGRSCVAFTPRDELVIHVQGGPALILRAYDSLIVGSGPNADVYAADLPAQAVRITALGRDSAEVSWLGEGPAARMPMRVGAGGGPGVGVGSMWLSPTLGGMRLGPMGVPSPIGPPRPPLAGAPMPMPRPFTDTPGAPPLAGAVAAPESFRVQPEVPASGKEDGLWSRLRRLFGS